MNEWTKNQNPEMEMRWGFQLAFEFIVNIPFIPYRYFILPLGCLSTACSALRRERRGSIQAGLKYLVSKHCSAHRLPPRRHVWTTSHGSSRTFILQHQTPLGSESHGSITQQADFSGYNDRVERQGRCQSSRALRICGLIVS